MNIYADDTRKEISVASCEIQDYTHSDFTPLKA